MRPILIFSGSNDRAIISFCRYAEKHGIDFNIVANGEEDLIFLTEYKKFVIGTRNKNELNLDLIFDFASLVKNKTRSNELVILPSTEYLNRFLVNNEEALKSQNIFTGLVSEKLYKEISDKYSFGVLCQKYGIDIPQEFDQPPNEFPYVFKPRSYDTETKNLEKPAIINNSKDAEKYVKDRSLDHYYFQEYIGGRCIYLLFHISKSGNYSVYSQENLVQQYNGGSMILAQSSNFQNENVSKKFLDLLINEGYHGLIMIELKNYKGKYFMIEANPRLWGPSQLILDSGMDLFDAWSFDLGLVKSKSSFIYKEQVFYFWEGGISADNDDLNQLTFYNGYDKDTLIENYNNYKSIEVYNREDTINIYNKENNHG